MAYSDIYWCSKCLLDHWEINYYQRDDTGELGIPSKIYQNHLQYKNVGKRPYSVWKQLPNGRWKKVISTEEEKKKIYKE